MEAFVGLKKTLRCGLSDMPFSFETFSNEASLYSADLLTHSPDRIGKNGSIDVVVRMSGACKKATPIFVFSEYRTYFTVDADGVVDDHFRDPEPYDMNE